MLKLYYAPKTRSIRPLWLLEELGVPYEKKLINIYKGEHKTPEYRQLNPHGWVPTLTDDETTIFESVAICFHLADKFSEKDLFFAPGSIERGLCYQWGLYLTSTPDPALFRIFFHSFMLPEEKRSPQVVEKNKGIFLDSIKVLETALSNKEYLVGNRFSVADVLIGSAVFWAEFMGLIEGSPILKKYTELLKQRPAYQKAIEV